jgi:hypothetical protein
MDVLSSTGQTSRATSLEGIVPDQKQYFLGGDDGTRTHDPLLAKQVL